jgi:hypothetical protein
MEEALYKFSVGQAVRLSASHLGRIPGGFCTITGQLPEHDGEPQYRVKFANELRERVVRESELSKSA